MALGWGAPQVRKVGVLLLTQAQGLKPSMIQRDLRGPEAPLFHGDTCVWAFFRSPWNSCRSRQRRIGVCFMGDLVWSYHYDYGRNASL